MLYPLVLEGVKDIYAVQEGDLAYQIGEPIKTVLEHKPIQKDFLQFFKCSIY